MKYLKIGFDSKYILQVYALRHSELREPLGLNLFDEDLLEERNENFFIGVNDENEVLTCLQLNKLENGTLKLRQMATNKRFQGQGFGNSLVRFAEKWAIKNGYKIIELHARENALGFYKKLDYNIVGDTFMEVDIPHFKMTKEL